MDGNCIAVLIGKQPSCRCIDSCDWLLCRACRLSNTLELAYSFVAIQSFNDSVWDTRANSANRFERDHREIGFVNFRWDELAQIIVVIVCSFNDSACTDAMVHPT